MLGKKIFCSGPYKTKKWKGLLFYKYTTNPVMVESNKDAVAVLAGIFFVSNKKHPLLTPVWSRHHQVYLLVVHMAEASSPSGWNEHALCSRSQPQQSNSAGQNVPCRNSRNHDADWPAIPTCWCRHVLCRYTLIEDAPADCGCCSGLSFLLIWVLEALDRGRNEKEVRI